MSQPNQVIRLTGIGVSALATLRLAGPGVAPFLKQHFSRPAVPGRIVHGELRDDSGVIDDPVVTLAEDSSSADITLHGGTWVVEALIACAVREGFDLVENAKSTDLLDGSDTLAREIEAALPLARTELAAKWLLAQNEAWRSWIKTSPDPRAIQNVLDDRSLHHLLHPPSVAIVGLPNAGKSTLANQLFGSDRSIVSPIAGTTRDWVGEEANLDGLIVTLIDTPGRHDTPDAIERTAILQSESPVAAADLVIDLLDATVPIDAQLAQFAAFPRSIVAVNKIDLARDAVTHPSLRDRSPVMISAATNAGIDALRDRIKAFFDIDRRPPASPRCWTARQADLLRTAVTDPAALQRIFA